MANLWRTEVYWQLFFVSESTTIHLFFSMIIFQSCFHYHDCDHYYGWLFVSTHLNLRRYEVVVIVYPNNIMVVLSIACYYVFAGSSLLQNKKLMLSCGFLFHLANNYESIATKNHPMMNENVIMRNCDIINIIKITLSIHRKMFSLDKRPDSESLPKQCILVITLLYVL